MTHFNFRQNSGSTIVGVLAALVFIGVISTFMVTNTRSQSNASTGYSSMKTVSTSTVSGLIGTEAFFSQTDSLTKEEITSKLMLVSETGTPEWLLPSFMTIAGEQKFKSQLISFNTSDMQAQVEVTGRGKSGTERQSVGYYKLGNLTLQTGGTPKYGLYARGNLTNVDRGIDVSGDILIGGRMHVNSGTSTFRGKFAAGVLDNSSYSSLDADVAFEDNAYFAGGMYVNSPDLTFEKKVGFEEIQGGPDPSSSLPPSGTATYVSGGNLLLEDDGYFNGQVDGSGNPIDMDTTNSAFHSENSFNEHLLRNKSTVQKQDPFPDLPSLLQMPGSNDTVSALSMDSLDNSKIVTYSNDKTLTVAELNDLYDNKPKVTLGGDEYLVVKLEKGGSINQASETFNKKLILWVSHGDFNVNGGFYNSGDDANTLVYVNGNGKLNGMGTNGLFRGLIHVESSFGNPHLYNTYEWGPDAVLEGALHHVSDQQIQINGNETGSRALRIKYEKEAISPFNSLRTDTPSSATPQLVINSQISPVPFAYYFR